MSNGNLKVDSLLIGIKNIVTNVGNAVPHTGAFIDVFVQRRLESFQLIVFHNGQVCLKLKMNNCIRAASQIDNPRATDRPIINCADFVGFASTKGGGGERNILHKPGVGSAIRSRLEAFCARYKDSTSVAKRWRKVFGEILFAWQIK